jgi:hypothetical protein
VGATATLTNTGTAASKTVKTDNEGVYSFLDVAPGTYSTTIDAQGFEQRVFANLVLQSRDTQRIDVKLTVGATNSTIIVQAAGAVINTDVSNLAETRTGLELNTLPLAISSRASGSTSPFATLTSQAGVQTDSLGNISIAGAKPSLLSVTIDGISTMNVESSAPSAELFPSFNSIEEIRVSQTRTPPSSAPSAISRPYRKVERTARTAAPSITTKPPALMPKARLPRLSPNWS